MKNSKFIPLYETIYNRYKQGSGFLEGDIVKLKDNYKSTEGYKSLNDSVRVRLEDCTKRGFNLRVGRLHTPDNQFGSYGYLNLPATHADLYQELAPGNYGNLVTVPLDLLEVIDTENNLAPIAPENKRTDKEAPYQKPSKHKPNKDEETDDQTNLAEKQTKVKNGDYKLAEKNKKPGVGANDYNDEKPSKFKNLPDTVSESLETKYEKLLTENEELEEVVAEPEAREETSALEEDDKKKKATEEDEESVKADSEKSNN